MSASRLTSALKPAPDADHDDAPAGGQRLEVAGRFGAPTSSRIDVERAVLLEALGSSTASAPSSATASRSRRVADGRGDVRAGRAAELHRRGPDAAGGAVDEEPLAHPQPRLGEDRVVAVVKTSGSPPACGHSMPAGTGMSWRSWMTASSPARRRRRCPSRDRPRRSARRPGPSAATSPASSSPGMSGRRAGRAGVAALALQDVGAVDARRADADQDLAVPGLRVRVVGNGQRLVCNRRRAHGAAVWSVAR
jgi:hypothetical protein